MKKDWNKEREKVKKDWKKERKLRNKNEEEGIDGNIVKRKKKILAPKKREKIFGKKIGRFSEKTFSKICWIQIQLTKCVEFHYQGCSTRCKLFCKKCCFYNIWFFCPSRSANGRMGEKFGIVSGTLSLTFLLICLTDSVLSDGKQTFYFRGAFVNLSANRIVVCFETMSWVYFVNN